MKNILHDLAEQGEPDGLEQVVSRLETALAELKNADALVVDRLSELNETDTENFPDHALEEEISNNAQIQEDIEAFILSVQLKLCTKVSRPTRDEKPTHHKLQTLRSPKMPAIKLPNFSGDLLLWPTFWDSFRAYVHENPEYSKVAKIPFLKEHGKW